MSTVRFQQNWNNRLRVPQHGGVLGEQLVVALNWYQARLTSLNSEVLQKSNILQETKQVLDYASNAPPAAAACTLCLQNIGRSERKPNIMFILIFINFTLHFKLLFNQLHKLVIHLWTTIDDSYVFHMPTTLLSTRFVCAQRKEDFTTLMPLQTKITLTIIITNHSENISMIW